MKTEIEIGGRYKIAENLILQRSRWISGVTYVVLDVLHGVAFYEFEMNGSMHAGAEDVARLSEEWAEVPKPVFNCVYYMLGSIFCSEFKTLQDAIRSLSGREIDDATIYEYVPGEKTAIVHYPVHQLSKVGK